MLLKSEIEEIKKKRRFYLWLFIAVFILNFVLVVPFCPIIKSVLALIWFTLSIVFLIKFLKVCKLTGYSIYARIGVIISTFIPIIALITIGILDLKIYRFIRENEIYQQGYYAAHQQKS